MIAIDAQILVFAHRKDSAWHARARACVASLAEGNTKWAIPMHCLVEFYAKVTHRLVYRPPTTPAKAIEQIEIWQESPTLTVLGDDPQTWTTTQNLARAGRIAGNQIYDARIAAVCLRHGVTELWTADRDFASFPSLRTRNPLVDIQPTGASEPRAAYVTRATSARGGQPRRRGRGEARRR